MKKYPIYALDLIKKIQIDFPGFEVERDDTLSLRQDLISKLNNETDRYNTTMRFRRGKIRTPPPHHRVTLYKDDNMIPENQIGYLVLKKNFIVCKFSEADKILADSGCKPETIKKRKQRLQGIYGEISPDDIISIYLIKKFIDESSYINEFL